MKRCRIAAGWEAWRTGGRRRGSGPIRLGVGSRPATRRENIPRKVFWPGPDFDAASRVVATSASPDLAPWAAGGARVVVAGLGTWPNHRVCRPVPPAMAAQDLTRSTARPAAWFASGREPRVPPWLHGASVRRSVDRRRWFAQPPRPNGRMCNGHPVGFVRPGCSTVPALMCFYDPTIRSVVLAIGSEA